MFLVSGRATAITLLAPPLSVIVTLLVMRATGATINTMTLGGIAIALGALVDDAIIVVENIVRRLCENRSRPEAEQASAHRVVFEATREIESSIVFATLIIIIVFVPLFFLARPANSWGPPSAARPFPGFWRAKAPSTWWCAIRRDSRKT